MSLSHTTQTLKDAKDTHNLHGVGLHMPGNMPQHLPEQSFHHRLNLGLDIWNGREMHALLVIQEGMNGAQPQSLLCWPQDSSRSRVIVAAIKPALEVQHSTSLHPQLHNFSIISVSWPGPCHLPSIHKLNVQHTIFLYAMAVEGTQHLCNPALVHCFLEPTLVLLV